MTSRFRTVRLTQPVLELTGRLPERHLGTLVAIHTATALTIEATDFVSYDTRRCSAAAAEGLNAASPSR